MGAAPKGINTHLSDLCLQPGNEGVTYFHDGNCKQYWQCEGSLSVAKCCPGLERLNRRTGKCEYQADRPCDPVECNSCWPGVCEYPVWTGMYSVVQKQPLKHLNNKL